MNRYGLVLRALSVAAQRATIRRRTNAATANAADFSLGAMIINSALNMSG
jgi:hypothetical protein